MIRAPEVFIESMILCVSPAYAVKPAPQSTSWFDSKTFWRRNSTESERPLACPATTTSKVGGTEIGGSQENAWPPFVPSRCQVASRYSPCPVPTMLPSGAIRKPNVKRM